MSADLLRRAAQFLRTRAEATAPGPWIVVDPNEGTEYGPFFMVVNDAFLNPRDDDEVALELELHTGAQPGAYYVEAMHPPVALALAAWLDAAAEVANYGSDGFDLDAVDDTYRGAVTTARAILREVTP